MFWKKRNRPEEDDDDEIEPKKRGRRIFGFECSPGIHLSAKAIAKQLHVDLKIVAEHGMQLGLTDMESTMKDPQETELLRQHLHEEHAMKHMVEAMSEYDAEAAGYIRDGQARKYHRERALRDLVDLSDRYGLDPILLKEIVVQELKRRRGG